MGKILAVVCVRVRVCSHVSHSLCYEVKGRLVRVCVFFLFVAIGMVADLTMANSIK